MSAPIATPLIDQKPAAPSAADLDTYLATQAAEQQARDATAGTPSQPNTTSHDVLKGGPTNPSLDTTKFHSAPE